jgi:hypothetical protein
MLASYHTDLTAWANRTAHLLREKRWEEVDWEHPVEEVKDLGKSERSTIGSQRQHPHKCPHKRLWSAQYTTTSSSATRSIARSE